MPIELAPGLMTALRELGAAHGATPFMVMLAALEVVLHRHTGQADLVVGVPVANRKRVAAEGLAGTLVNTLPLRVRFEPQATFLALLERTRHAAIDAYAHQDLPFERLVSELGVERRPGVSPLVQVMFDFQNAPTPLEGAGALQLKPLALSRGAAQFDLSLLVFDTELGQTAGLEYSTELFDQPTIERLAEHYVSVLQTVVRDPSAIVSRLPVLSTGERAEVLALSRATCLGQPPAPLVHERFAAQALATPEAPAVIDQAGVVNYGVLRGEVLALASRLRALGVGPGERVAIYLDRTRAKVAALLAVLETGAAYVPLDPRHPPLRVGYVLEHAAPRLVLTRTSLRAQLGEQPEGRVLCVDDGVPVVTGEAAPPPLPADPARAAYVIYTSGSTGRPKGVEVPVGALANFLRSMQHTPGLGPADKVLSVTTIAFDIAALELFLPLITGACVHVASADVVADAQKLKALMAEVAPTLMQATPATWRMLIEAGWRGDPRLTVLSGGEALSPDLARGLLERAGAVWNMYGPTETTVWSTLHRVTAADEVVPIGRPIDETPVYVLDEHRQLCPLGVAGELCIGGAGVATGYFRQPALTQERFVADPWGPSGARLYHTGDLARLKPSGVFEHLGRLDHQIKIRGFRIEPSEIEAVLKETAAVKEALVIAREDRKNDVRLVAYYVPTAAGAVPADELRRALERRLPEYMIPSAFVELEALPQTPNGKVDRAQLPAPAAAHTAVVAAHVGPRTETEARLSRLWEEVLGVKRPSVHQSFFQLGGHSLLAVQLFSRLEREFGVELPLGTLFEAPTIALLAERIKDRSVAWLVGFRYVVPIQPGGSSPPLFCVHGAGGNVIHLETLARHLGPQRPFYGLQAAGVDGRSEPFARLEQMAAAYLEEVKLVQPEGPYLLSGYCGGGAVAFEMARLLRARGESVGLVALFDTYRPGISVSARLRSLQRQALSEGGLGWLFRGVVRRVTRVSRRWAMTLRVQWHRLRGAVPHELRDFWLTNRFFSAIAHYRPQPYGGRLTVFKAKQVHPMLEGVDRELGWTGLAEQGIEAYEVPGDHDTVLEDANARVLAEQLTRCLASAERPGQP